MTVYDRLKYDFWVTAERQFLYFHEMSTSHLNNTIAMLTRKAAELQEEDEVNLRFSFDAHGRVHPRKWVSQQPAFQGLIAERKLREARRKAQQ